MKRPINTLLALLSLAITLPSCTFYTQVQVADPIDIDVQSVKDVKNIIVLNRTGVKKGQGGNNVLEGIFTGELPGGDKEGAKQCVMGLTDCLRRSLNYKNVNLLPVTFYGSGDRNVPAELPWGLVDSICKANNADALVALEFFDSNAGISLGLTNPNVPVGYGANTNNVSVKTFWRYYNSQSKTVVDFYEQRNVSNNGRFKSPYVSQNVMDKYNTTKSISFGTGLEYGYRISEQILNEARICYSGGSKSMRIAGRYARLGEWETASNMWDELTHSSKRKVRARALYNKAVYFERMGNLETALEFATQSAAVKYQSPAVILVARLKQQMNDRQRMISSLSN